MKRSRGDQILLPPRRLTTTKTMAAAVNRIISTALRNRLQRYLATNLQRRSFSTGRRRTKVRTATARSSQLHEKYGIEQYGFIPDEVIDEMEANKPDNMLDAFGAGEKQTFDEYLESANLSPWVPTPDMVGRSMLELAGANRDDVHYDLGSGDGRLNFLAIDEPFRVKKTVGIDVDPKMVRFSKERGKILLKDKNGDSSSAGSDNSDVADDEEAEESQALAESIVRYKPELSFFCADLLATGNEGEKSLPSNVDLSECTVLTMYFVESALKKLRPMLEERFGGTGCRIVTNQYEVPGWEAQKIEIVSGMKIHLYILE